MPAIHLVRGGQQVITGEDLSEEVANLEAVQWRVTVQSLGKFQQNSRFVAFVEDAVAEQLVAVHQHPRCSFSTSWKAFNQQHQGQRHRALSRCQWMLGLFLLLGGASIYVVYQELEIYRLSDGTQQLRRFHWVVMAKFLLQDVPQQVCFVLYIFGWYEAGGLRCQLCLFDAKHCSEEDAFHISNIMTAGCILLSSLANQLLIRPVRKRRYTEDDVCMQFWIRIGGTCVATVPFTTGLCLSSRSLVSSGGFGWRKAYIARQNVDPCSLQIRLDCTGAELMASSSSDHGQAPVQEPPKTSDDSTGSSASAGSKSRGFAASWASKLGQKAFDLKAVTKEAMQQTKEAMQSTKEAFTAEAKMVAKDMADLKDGVAEGMRLTVQDTQHLRERIGQQTRQIFAKAEFRVVVRLLRKYAIHGSYEIGNGRTVIDLGQHETE
eukprot:symbB.v1.2.025492.t1/scaffold2478.1/size78220/1